VQPPTSSYTAQHNGAAVNIVTCRPAQWCGHQHCNMPPSTMVQPSTLSHAAQHISAATNIIIHCPAQWCGRQHCNMPPSTMVQPSTLSHAAQHISAATNIIIHCPAQWCSHQHQHMTSSTMMQPSTSAHAAQHIHAATNMMCMASYTAQHNGAAINIIACRPAQRCSHQSFTTPARSPSTHINASLCTLDFAVLRPAESSMALTGASTCTLARTHRTSTGYAHTCTSPTRAFYAVLRRILPAATLTTLHAPPYPDDPRNLEHSCCRSCCHSTATTLPRNCHNTAATRPPAATLHAPPSR